MYDRTIRSFVLAVSLVAAAACDPSATAPNAPRVVVPSGVSRSVVNVGSYADPDIGAVFNQEPPECYWPWVTCRALQSDELALLDDVFGLMWFYGCYDQALALYQMAHSGDIIVGVTQLGPQYGGGKYGATIPRFEISGSDTVLVDMVQVLDLEEVFGAWYEEGIRTVAHESIHADDFFDGNRRGMDSLFDENIIEGEAANCGT